MNPRLTCLAIIVITGLAANYLLGMAVYKALTWLVWVVGQ